MIKCIGSLDIYFTPYSSLLFLWSNWFSCGWYVIRIRFWWENLECVLLDTLSISLIYPTMFTSIRYNLVVVRLVLCFWVLGDHGSQFEIEKHQDGLYFVSNLRKHILRQPKMFIQAYLGSNMSCIQYDWMHRLPRYLFHTSWPVQADRKVY